MFGNFSGMNKRISGYERREKEGRGVDCVRVRVCLCVCDCLLCGAVSCRVSRVVARYFSFVDRH